MKLAYFSYPYSDNPRKRTEEIKKIVRKILERHKDIVPLIPHLVFDALYDYPKGYTHPEFSDMELELISRVDLFVYDPKDALRSRGVRWELAYAKRCRGVKIITYDELMKE